MSSEPRNRLILLPGLGADARMFETQRERFPHLEVPDWLDPHKRETLESYGQRFAESLEYDENCIVGGTSFGGMLAVEMSRHITPRKLILIGSALSFSEITFLLRTVSRLARWMPPSAFRLGVLQTRLTARWFGLQTQAQRQLSNQMMSDAAPAFVRWGCIALSNWSGLSTELPIARLHGAEDRIIPPLNDGSQTLIPEAGHVPSMSHPQAVNDWLETELVSS